MPQQRKTVAEQLAELQRKMAALQGTSTAPGGRARPYYYPGPAPAAPAGALEGECGLPALAAGCSLGPLPRTLLLLLLLCALAVALAPWGRLPALRAPPALLAPLAPGAVWLPAVPPLSSCARNPYLHDWGEARFAAAAASLADYRATQNALALDSEVFRHEVGWWRFNATPAFSACPSLARFPKVDTTMEDGKWLCGIEALREGCVVYSLGSNADFNFEYEVVEHTPCQVHTFDCTVSESEARFPADLQQRGRGRIHFHPWCVGQSGGRNGANYFSLRELAEKLGHAQVDLLKMDVEGYEYRVVQTIFAEALQSSLLDSLPMQVSFEMHAWQPDVSGPAAALSHEDGLSAGDMQIFWTQLSELGYVPVSRETNKYFTLGMEFTVVRAFC